MQEQKNMLTLTLAAILAAGFTTLASPAHAECTSTATADDGKYFVADSFSFGVEREMKESGEKGGTDDTSKSDGANTTNASVGVGELQECTISKSSD